MILKRTPFSFFLIVMISGLSAQGADLSGTGGLSICSKLDFSNLDWPTTKSTAERDPFALALNISGSFEGSDGWENLTNNFDGQGLSLGLLNQCLGQGSLQPMLIEMQNEYSAEMKAQFTVTNFNSLHRDAQGVANLRQRGG